MMNGERIAKFMAHAGIASRRDSERLIEAGRVSVNGQRISSPALNITEADVIAVDGRVVQGKPPMRLWLYNKPAGLVTTAKDPEGRPTVFDALPKEMGRVISVGRLDLNSEGLLLLTNNGELSRHLELPATGLTRNYRVRVMGAVTPQKIALMERGMTVEGIHYDSIIVRPEKEGIPEGRNQWLEVTLREGKNREIRRVMEALELRVNRLIRVSYGPFQLAALPVGATVEVPMGQIKRYFGKALKL